MAALAGAEAMRQMMNISGRREPEGRGKQPFEGGTVKDTPTEIGPACRLGTPTRHLEKI